MALSALSAGVITPNTTFFRAPTWTLPGTQRRYRDWLKTGHGMLNVTKAIEESADTFFYQVAFEMGIDRIHEWLSKFGYGQSTGIDLNEEYAGVLPSREWKQRVHKKPRIRGHHLGRHRPWVLDRHPDPDGEGAYHSAEQW